MRYALALVLLAAAGCQCSDRAVPPSGRSDARSSGGDAARSDAIASADSGGADAASVDALAFDATSLDAAAADAEPQDAVAADAVVAADASPADAALADAGNGAQVFDVRIFVSNTCVVSTTPPSITVPGGTRFTVHWFNLASSASNADIAKIDQFNQVPIVIGLEPGNDYHDTIREWCGTLFQGEFDFRITGCDQPYYLHVDCR